MRPGRSGQVAFDGATVRLGDYVTLMVTHMDENDVIFHQRTDPRPIKREPRALAFQVVYLVGQEGDTIREVGPVRHGDKVADYS